MDSTLQTLTGQHRAVQRRVRGISDAVARGDTTTLEAALRGLYADLLEHLRLEDAQLYPELVRLAQLGGREDLVTLAESFASSMVTITLALTRFLEHQLARPPQIELFREPWERTARMLSARIVMEETSLYPLYARLAATADRVEAKPTAVRPELR